MGYFLSPVHPLISRQPRGICPAQTITNPSPPEQTIKLIFLHHSVGEGWLADDQGGLGLALQNSNYFVSDTYYGWGPDGIGDQTDTLNWPIWFTGPESDRYMAAVYNESSANAAGYSYYTRTISDPGGENQVIVFKSCFPNSDLGGKPNDPPAPGADLTVSSAKYAYNRLLPYFASHPEKLFVLITSPPMQYIDQPENARAISNWLVDDWLTENNYPLSNVAVFDFYNVLTHPDNHHRYRDGEIEHLTNAGSDTLYYDSDGDDHPNARGGQKHRKNLFRCSIFTSIAGWLIFPIHLQQNHKVKPTRPRANHLRWSPWRMP